VAAAASERGLIDEIDYSAFVAIEETDELAEVRRSDIVVDGVEVAMIGDVECVDAEPDVVHFAAPVSEKRHAKLAIKLHIQGKVFREALPVGSAHVLLLNIDRGIRKAGVNVKERAER
jgi:hypothetical protein